MLKCPIGKVQVCKISAWGFESLLKLKTNDMIRKTWSAVIARIYYGFVYNMASNGPIHYIAQIEESVKTCCSAFEYTWSEMYLNRIEYLRRRANGIECTYQDVEEEYLDACAERIREAIKEFEKSRKKFGTD